MYIFSIKQKKPGLLRQWCQVVAVFEEAQWIWGENNKEVCKVGATSQEMDSSFIHNGFQVSNIYSAPGTVLSTLHGTEDVDGGMPML